ncbi:zinc finger, CCHC-type containing protein [Tanacetum coccineum]
MLVEQRLVPKREATPKLGIVHSIAKQPHKGINAGEGGRYHTQPSKDEALDKFKVVRLLDLKLKTLGERGIECIFVGNAKHSKAFRIYVIDPNDSVSINSIIESMDAIFDENRFFSVPRPSLGILNGSKDTGGLVVHEEVTDEKEVINDEMDSIIGNNTCILVDLTPGCKPLGCKCILKRKLKVDGTIEKFKTTFLNGKLDEELYMNQPQGFIMPDNENKLDLTKEFLSSRFSMKDIGETDVILGIRIKHESNGIAIYQSYYTKKVLKKFNYFDYTRVSTPMDTSEKLMPNNGQAVSQLMYYMLIDSLMYAMTCTRPGIAFAIGYTGASLTAASKEAEWLKNMLIENSLWSKPIAHISICCDSAPTLTKAYSQVQNQIVVKREFMSLKMFSELLFSEAKCNFGLNDIHKSHGFNLMLPEERWMDMCQIKAMGVLRTRRRVKGRSDQGPGFSGQREQFSHVSEEAEGRQIKLLSYGICNIIQCEADCPLSLALGYIRLLEDYSNVTDVKWTFRDWQRRLICNLFNPNVIDAKIVIGELAGVRVLLPIIPLAPYEEEDMFLLS